MSSNIFTRIDRRHFANALGANTGHADLTTFEQGLDIDTGAAGSIVNRSNALVTYIFDKSKDTDQVILDLLNFFFVDSGASEIRMDSKEYGALKAKVLDLRGVLLDDEGFSHPKSNADKTTVTSDVSATNFNSGVTPLTEATYHRTSKPMNVPDKKYVFIVQGRDHRPVQALEQYLHFLGLKVLTWVDAVKLTGKSAPETFEVVKTGLAKAGAIIVIFSPDDEARLNPVLTPNEPAERPTGQPRQNVLLEAGMAFAMAPERTIFVKSAHTRAISDIQGFHWVYMNGAWDSREDLKNRLENAGLAPAPARDNLMDTLAGPFKVV